MLSGASKSHCLVKLNKPLHLEGLSLGQLSNNNSNLASSRLVSQVLEVNRLRHLLVSNLNLELNNSKRPLYSARHNSSHLFLVNRLLEVNNKHKPRNSEHNLQGHFLVNNLEQEEVSLEVKLSQLLEDQELVLELLVKIQGLTLELLALQLKHHFLLSLQPAHSLVLLPLKGPQEHKEVYSVSKPKLNQEHFSVDSSNQPPQQDFLGLSL